MSEPQEIECVLAEYTAKAEEWSSLVLRHAAKANRHFDRLHDLAKSHRSNQLWRVGLEHLTRSQVPGVRLLAATECLTWNPTLAAQVLTELADTATLHAVTAKYTLIEFRNGNLNLDWLPR